MRQSGKRHRRIRRTIRAAQMPPEAAGLRVQGRVLEVALQLPGDGLVFLLDGASARILKPEHHGGVVCAGVTTVCWFKPRRSNS